MDFVTRRTEFETVLTLVSTVIDSRSRLPGMVFHSPPRRCACIEFDLVLEPDFWNELSVLARHYDDANVACLVIEPDPGEAMYRDLGYYGALVLPTSAPAERYVAAIHYEPPEVASAIVFGGMLIAFVSTSGGVAVWADRDAEIAIVGLFDVAGHTAPDFSSALPWLSADQALDAMRPAFQDQVVPSAFRRSFVQHYGRCNSPNEALSPIARMR